MKLFENDLSVPSLNHSAILYNLRTTVPTI